MHTDLKKYVFPAVIVFSFRTFINAQQSAFNIMEPIFIILRSFRQIILYHIQVLGILYYMEGHQIGGFLMKIGLFNDITTGTIRY